MTVQQEVPTGAEVRAHIERWRELPESERPEYPAMVWAWHYQRWEPEDLFHSLYRFPDDDTPQPGLRLVPLPVPVGVGWRRPVDKWEAEAAERAGVLQWDDEGYDCRLPASWAEGQERVGLSRAHHHTIGGDPVTMIHWPGDHGHETGWVDLSDGAEIDATIIDGTAYVWVDPLPEPAPETERVPWWEAAGRTHVSGRVVESVRTTVEGAVARARGGDVLAAAFSADGTVEVLVEPESAVPATDFVPTSAVSSSERASEVVGGGGGAGATTPTRPDPPEGWVVCRDREILRAADKRRMVRWWCGSWSDPLGGWDYDARYVDDDRFAVPVDMVAEPESWVPQRGERVLMEAVIEDDGVGSHAGPDPLVHFVGSHNGTTATRIPVGSLRPFPEDGEA